MAFTLPTLRSALAICQDLHTKAVANADDTMIVKWQSEIDRITRDMDMLKNKGQS